jgi:hypothetical protein
VVHLHGDQGVVEFGGMHEPRNRFGVSFSWARILVGMSDERLLDTVRRLAERLSPGHLDATLSQVTAAAVELLPDVKSASITIRYEDGSIKTVAPTGEIPVSVDAEQYRLQQGSCFHAATDMAQVTSSDLTADERWPSLAEFGLAHGVQALMALRPFDGQHFHGALNLYSTSVGAFDDAGALGALFAHQAGSAVACAQEMTGLAEAVKTRTISRQAGSRDGHGALQRERRAGFRFPPTVVIPPEHENCASWPRNWSRLAERVQPASDAL